MPILSDTRLTELAGKTKPPAVAGLFYPDDPQELRHLLRQMLARAGTDPIPPKALIAPHAGYVYSGPVAATAYATLTPARHRITRVVLLGPAHRVYLQGLALARVDQFATPLGTIAVDKELADRISALPQVSYNDAAFAQEHSLEVHLPFLQTVLDHFTLLPVVVGEASADQVAELLQLVWGGDETLIVISSDLSHYHDYATATILDRQTSEHILRLRYDKVGASNACGCRPIDGLLKLARERDYRIEILDLRNSGDTAGSRDRVVGYGAYALYPAIAFDDQIRAKLIGIAAASIEHGLTQDKAKLPDPGWLPAVMQRPAAVFITLTLEDSLRGCIGSLEPVAPLATAVAVNAFNAAFRDPRFPRLSADEFRQIEIGISILSDKTEIRFESEQALIDQLQPDITGLIIASGMRKATFLPAVWKTIPQPEQFLAWLKQKAGIGNNEVPQQAWTYSSVSFSGRPFNRQD